MDRRYLLCLLCFLVAQVSGQNNSTTDDGSFPYDPILQYRPNFARSLPVEILMTGIVLTLTSVLLIHLVFTAQYHWPLAPLNCGLQMSAVTTLLVSQIASIVLILSNAAEESSQWPYMLNYIAVGIPPLVDNTQWSTAGLAAWLLMNATTSGLIQITHIQFLTLLFPSKLERRLIYTLLGPLAILSAVMQIMHVRDDDQLISICSAVQNICNATLSLLFTTSLFLWGTLVNRRQAWRMDGGTAAFGAGALTLALLSSAITFLYIPSKNQFVWMPGLMWAVVLWQSFLGWWWWVGAGMGVGEVDELLKRAEKRRAKRMLQMEKKKMRKEKAQTVWKGVTGAFGRAKAESLAQDAPLESVSVSSGTDMSASGTSRWRPSRGADPLKDKLASDTLTSQSTGRSTVHPPGQMMSFLFNHHAGRTVYRWFTLIRHAHLTAAREQAVERKERITQAYGKDGAELADGEHAVIGWGLGSFGMRRYPEGPEEVEMELRESDCDSYRGPVDADADEWRDEDTVRDIVMDDTESTSNATSEGVRTRARDRATPDESPRPRSLWWWGPLQRWRLQDVTTY